MEALLHGVLLGLAFTTSAARAGTRCPSAAVMAPQALVPVLVDFLGG